MKTIQQTCSRRSALKLVGLGTGVLMAGITTARETVTHRMTINLMCGMIGVQANQLQAINLAHRHRFQSVEAMPQELARMSELQLVELRSSMKEMGVDWGAAGLPVEFRQDEDKFKEGIESLPRLAAALKRAGVKRVGTWLMPGHNSLTYLQNFKQHAKRLGEIVRILNDHDVRFGLEYVGTKTLRDRFHYEFIHTMAETRELISAIGMANVGFILDSWHWWNAGETQQDIQALKNEDVVAVDLNDAPAGIPKEQQVDGRRELPLATGVIDAKSFLTALAKIGYDGPVRAEPFNKELNELEDDAACARTSEALHKAFKLIGA